MYYVGDDREKSDRLWFALFLAAAAHTALILGVSFDGTGGPLYTPQIEVTLARRPSTQAPEDARVMAQADQLGSGDESPQNEVTAREQAPQASPRPTEQALRNSPDPLSEQPQAPTLVSSAESNRSALPEPVEEQPQEIPLPGINPEVERLNEQLASLEANLDQQVKAYSNMPRVKRITSVAARQSADAAYLHEWRTRVEAVGNRYYPEASVRYGIYGSLRLLVVIRHDGSLEDIRVLSSSGYAVLDEAATKIVRMAAPFAAFPAELRAEADKLEIIRTWQFQENQLSSN